jgi:hypothetical protein
MTALLYPLMPLAACGFILSVAAQILALTGIPLPGGNLVWMLHVGIFVVLIPAVLVSARCARYPHRRDFWKVVLAGCPAWMRRAVYVIFGYAIFNFILFMFIVNGHPKPAGDAPPSVIRGFSGHGMAFYSAAFAILYAVIHSPNLLRERKCPWGHSVSPAARFCPECGHAFPEEPKADS